MTTIIVRRKEEHIRSRGCTARCADHCYDRNGDGLRLFVAEHVELTCGQKHGPAYANGLSAESGVEHARGLILNPRM